ncbi:hypothetical protein IH982_02605 [Patescibacteria group bacterium]|nr:hypothetical protein [Patescibacteria group bacterium]
MIYIIGLNHGYQSQTDTWPPIHGVPLEKKSKDQQQPFLRWLESQLLSDPLLVWVFEEWTYGNRQIPSIAFTLVEKLNNGIQHLQIDPMDRLFKDKSESNEHREKIWLEKILAELNPSMSGNALLIVGDEHVKTMEEKLKLKGYETKTIREVTLLESISKLS